MKFEISKSGVSPPPNSAGQSKVIQVESTGLSVPSSPREEERELAPSLLRCLISVFLSLRKVAINKKKKKKEIHVTARLELRPSFSCLHFDLHRRGGFSLMIYNCSLDNCSSDFQQISDKTERTKSAHGILVGRCNALSLPIAISK